MTPLVSQLWPQFMADPDFAACFGRVVVEHAQMLRQERQVIFTLRSSAPLDKGLCARLTASLQPDYEGFELRIHNLFGYPSLNETALRELMEEMKRDGVPINGFLDRCTIRITGQNIAIGVCHGTKFLQEMQFERLLAERIAAHTGVKPKVTLESSVGEAEQRQMEEKLERKIAPPVVKFEKKNTAPSIKVEGLDLTDKPVTIFHGKMFTPKNLTPLKDLGGEGGKCMIWGDVFFTEVKGNFRKIYTVSITDYTGSINLKIRAQEGEDCSKWESIPKGTTVVVRGDCSYDKYEHDYIVWPYDVLFVERKKREDNAPVKRVELHLHTKLSSMDAFCDPGGIVRLAHRMGHPAIAITDHGNMYGVKNFHDTATDAGVKPILGCEVYVAPGSRFDRETSRGEDRYYHLVLLAENNTGYSNLMKIVSAGFIDGFYYKPRVDMEILEKYHEGIIALSACLAGEVARAMVRNQYEMGKEAALRYEKIFGKGNFFLELQDHGISEQRMVNQQLMRLSAETGIELVATNDIHYTYAEDADSHDILLCLQTGKKITDEDRMRYEGGQYYVKSPEEMAELFPYALEALENTYKIAQRCHVEIEFGVTKLPRFDVPDGLTSWEYLKKLCFAGLEESSQPGKAEFTDRLDYLLSQITNL